MGFLGKNVKKSDSRTGTTVVAAGTRVVGDFQLDDHFHLDGEVQGSVKSTADVVIAVSGSLIGDISAKRVMISGKVDGKVDADRLEIVASGVVSGDINVRELVIEPGGQFVGASCVKKQDAPQLRAVGADGAGASE